MDYLYSDGGRAACGYKGEAGDCVVRAIAIAPDSARRNIMFGTIGFEIETLARQMGERGTISCSTRSNRVWRFSAGDFPKFIEKYAVPASNMGEGWYVVDVVAVQSALDALVQQGVITVVRHPLLGEVVYDNSTK